MKRFIFGTTLGLTIGAATMANSYAPATLIIQSTKPVPYSVIRNGVEQPPSPPGWPFFIDEGDQIVVQLDSCTELIDFDGNRRIGIADAIAALQVAAGMR